MRKVHQIAIFAPKSAVDLALGKGSKRFRRAAAVGVSGVEIGDARAVPDKRDEFAIRRPYGSRWMLDLKKLFNGELRLVGRNASLRAGSKCHRHDCDERSRCLLPLAHCAPCTDS